MMRLHLESVYLTCHSTVSSRLPVSVEKFEVRSRSLSPILQRCRLNRRVASWKLVSHDLEAQMTAQMLAQLSYQGSLVLDPETLKSMRFLGAGDLTHPSILEPLMDFSAVSVSVDEQLHQHGRFCAFEDIVQPQRIWPTLSNEGGLDTSVGRAFGYIWKV